MPSPGPFSLRIQLAAMSSEMPKELRHLVHVLALLGDQNACSGHHGQVTIAKAMGVSERCVRGLMKDLEAGIYPVRLERVARFRAEGRGRTSDAWKLILSRVQPAELSGKSGDQPAELSGGTDTTNRQSTTGLTGNLRHDQPAELSGDLRSDLRSDLEHTSKQAPKGKTGIPSKSKKRKPATKEEPLSETSPAHQLKLHYESMFRQTQGGKVVFTGAQWSRAMKAFRELGDLLELEKAKAVISNGLSDGYNKRLQPWELLLDVNKWSRGRPGVGNAMPPQQAGPLGFKVGR